LYISFYNFFILIFLVPKEKGKEGGKERERDTYKLKENEIIYIFFSLLEIVLAEHEWDLKHCVFRSVLFYMN